MGFMTAFYEIHDSIIESLVWDESALELTLSAVLTVPIDGKPMGYGRQKILLRIDSATLTGDKVEPEIWLLDGTFECEGEDSYEEDREIGYIGASLQYAREIRLIQLFGMNEDTHEYPTFDIRGKSMRLTRLGPIEWMSEYQPELRALRKFIGLGAFDSGLSDLATNKKYMEDFGLHSKGDVRKNDR
jgi:hypothetical protein